MLLKITEKIIRRNVFEQKKKKPGLSANQAFEQLARPVEHLLHIYSRRTLASVSSSHADVLKGFATRSCPRNRNAQPLKRLSGTQATNYKHLRQTLRYQKPSKPFHNETV